MLDPAAECHLLIRRNAGGLVREIRTDIAIHENNLAIVQRGFQVRLGFEAIAGVEEGSEVRIQGIQGAIIAVQELPYQLTEPGIILREARRINRMPAATCGKEVAQQIHLRTLSAAVNALEGDEFAERASVQLWLRFHFSEFDSSLLRKLPASSLTGRTLSRNAMRA